MLARTVLRRASLALAAALLVFPATCAETVILVRHAEKAGAPADNPALTAEGRQRAEALSTMLASSGVTSIYVTEYLRTQQTAEPLASLLHLTPQPIDAKKTPDLVAAIRRHKDGVALVVGHSNTVPEIIAALGGPPVKIEDSEYDSMFVLTISGKDVSLLRLRYGAASMPGVTSGQPMMLPKKKQGGSDASDQDEISGFGAVHCLHGNGPVERGEPAVIANRQTKQIRIRDLLVSADHRQPK
jgi:broad specificity phosphatase PhoE